MITILTLNQGCKNNLENGGGHSMIHLTELNGQVLNL